MKISNKILIGLLTTIFLTITAAFIDIRVFGVHRSENNPVKKTHIVNLGNYKYVKAVNMPSLEIRPSDYNHLNFIAYNDTVDFAIEHRIESDTLFLVGKKSSKHFTHYSLYTHSEIEHILSKNSNIELQGLNQDRFNMRIEGGEAYCWGSDSTRLSRFKKLKIDQINSNINLHNISTDTLEIDMVKSKAGFVRDILVLNADVKDESNLHLRSVRDVKFKRDNKSKVYFH